MTYIGFLRGINVGGHNILPMQDLRDSLKHNGFETARTYIQSGNLVFEHSERDYVLLETRIQDIIRQDFHFSPEVMIRRKEAVENIIEKNPFSERVADPKSMIFYFLKFAVSQWDEKKLQTLKKETESFHLLDDVFYLFAPEGIGRSKLAASVEKCLEAPCTARNLNTLRKLLWL